MTREEWLAHEFPPTVSGLHAAARERFLARVVVVDCPDACWHVTPSKPGVVGPVKAHRFAWELANGRRVPPSLYVRHHCGYGHEGCIRPSHLAPGTGVQNSADAIRHKRHGRGMAAYRAWLDALDRRPPYLDRIDDLISELCRKRAA